MVIITVVTSVTLNGREYDQGLFLHISTFHRGQRRCLLVILYWGHVSIHMSAAGNCKIPLESAT